MFVHLNRLANIKTYSKKTIRKLERKILRDFLKKINMAFTKLVCHNIEFVSTFSNKF